MNAAERLVSNIVLEATGGVGTPPRRTIVNDDHAVLLTATPSNDGRSIAVRVEPFESDEITEVQVLVSPARIVTHDTTPPAPAGTNGAVDPVIATPNGSTG
jgi:hypothetical protein